MKQRPGPSLTTGVLLMVALLVVIQASTTSLPQRGTDAEFRALIERYYAEWSKNDPDKAAPLYAKDADLVFFDLAPMKYTGWTEGTPLVKGPERHPKWMPRPIRCQ